MKKSFGYILLALIAASCSNSSDIFVLKGKFKNFNQGELYVYNLMGRGVIDTVRLSEGKFTYDILQEDTALLSVVFPNFSEIPVIATPGANLMMAGDATHLREVTVTGTKDNDRLTDFRLRVADKTPPEAEKEAAEFIKENPASPGCLYLLNRYFLLKTNPDYKKVSGLLDVMLKENSGNPQFTQLKKQVQGLKSLKVGSVLPDFTAVTTTGSRITKADLWGDVNVISTWASWSYDSQNIQRQLRKLRKEFGSRLQLVSICLDANTNEHKQTAKRDSISWAIICDGKMWQTPIISQLGINAVPDNIVTDKNGKIIARGLSAVELQKEIEKKLKK